MSAPNHEIATVRMPTTIGRNPTICQRGIWSRKKDLIASRNEHGAARHFPIDVTSVGLSDQ
jgi:hypothetical protein